MVENLKSLPLLSIFCVGKHWTRWIFKIFFPNTNILILSRKMYWSFFANTKSQNGGLS